MNAALAAPARHVGAVQKNSRYQVDQDGRPPGLRDHDRHQAAVDDEERHGAGESHRAQLTRRRGVKATERGGHDADGLHGDDQNRGAEERLIPGRSRPAQRVTLGHRTRGGNQHGLVGADQHQLPGDR